MSNCANHKKEVAGISDMKHLAELIGDLHYEALNELLKNLQTKLWEDGTKDINAGRKELGIAVRSASIAMEDVGEYINQAWDISKPFMQEIKP